MKKPIPPQRLKDAFAKIGKYDPNRLDSDVKKLYNKWSLRVEERLQKKRLLRHGHNLLRQIGLNLILKRLRLLKNSGLAFFIMKAKGALGWQEYPV